MAYTEKNSGMGLAAWSKEVFFTRRMNSWPGWIVMTLVGLGLGWAGHVDDKIPLIVVACAVTLLFVIVCFHHPELAYYAYLYSIVIFTLPARMFGIALPLGVLLEPTGYLAVLSIFAAQYRKRQDSANFWKTPISLLLLVLFFFYILEAFNPEINSSMEGWFKFFRKEIIYLLFYYVSFLMMDSMEKIRRFVKLWIILAVAVALWGIKQQWFGFTSFEDAWIHSDPTTTNLLFQGGMFRKFSLLPDPATFGVMTSSSALFTLVLAIRTSIKKHRRWLYFITILLMMASSYSGTRTCNVMLMAGLASYIVFTLNERRTITVLFTSVFVALFLLFGPFQNSPVIFRIKTTFDGSKEPSNMVRDVNRKNIQPYIYEHPIGGGLNTCGEEGNSYYPGHRLAGYPPDSGYMKIMLEQGWVGLALNLLLYFFILSRGARGFYDSKTPEVKTLYIAFTVCLFSLMMGQYSQLAISTYPVYLFYLASLVIFYKLKEYDKSNPETQHAALD